MTENKRFTFSEDIGCLDVPCANIFDNGKFIGTAILSDVEQLCDKLNAFQELSINDLKRIEELEKENGQLKQTIDGLTLDNTKQKKVLNATKKENKQLKQTIQDAYESERTQIGCNVLRQLMEAIQ